MRLVVVVSVDGVGPGLACEGRERRPRGAAADQEARTPRGELPFELPEALGEEPEPRRGDVLVPLLVVENEDGDDRFVSAERRVQGDVVVEAEVPAEPDD